ncbi:hypothetical protein BT63DRAFT_146999 [Microthyrium microscopicum]|uniref:Uncharacterized protein n=1 Tax=Microthyrium microscopicum TaxID=703497 RepID=A0A6A6UNV0_9PEZI|nr:hypothetical protein BT63DRAFT_146999 [Microthyrium microscopicum]
MVLDLQMELPVAEYISEYIKKSSKETAAQRVLNLPELLDQIFEWVHLDNTVHNTTITKRRITRPVAPYQREHTLFRCQRVNRAWFNEATRHLWSEPSRPCGDPEHHLAASSNCLLTLLLRIKPVRRQLYANNVRNAWFVVGPRILRADIIKDALTLIDFPKLKHMSWVISHDLFNSPATLPKIFAPNLESLFIRDGDQGTPSRMLSRQDLVNVLDSVRKNYPKDLAVHFWTPSLLPRRYHDLALIQARRLRYWRNKFDREDVPQGNAPGKSRTRALHFGKDPWKFHPRQAKPCPIYPDRSWRKLMKSWIKNGFLYVAGFNEALDFLVKDVYGHDFLAGL